MRAPRSEEPAPVPGSLIPLYPSPHHTLPSLPFLVLPHFILSVPAFCCSCHLPSPLFFIPITSPSLPHPFISSPLTSHLLLFLSPPPSLKPNIVLIPHTDQGIPTFPLAALLHPLLTLIPFLILNHSPLHTDVSAPLRAPEKRQVTKNRQK